MTHDEECDLFNHCNMQAFVPAYFRDRFHPMIRKQREKRLILVEFTGMCWNDEIATRSTTDIT